jgi:Amt family ammonium transporter
MQVSMVGLGTFILWFGWLGFNGGSAFGANLRAVMAVWNSMIAAAFAGMTWCLLDYRIGRKFSMVGFCSGTVAGLVAATPSSGYIPPWASLVLGVVVGFVSNFSTKCKLFVYITEYNTEQCFLVKSYLRVDDALDLGAEHAIGGMIGLLANAFFGTSAVISLDNVNTSTLGGFLDSNWKQLYIQFSYICATTAYTFVVTALIAKTIDMIPGLHLRSSEEGESLGMDEMEVCRFIGFIIQSVMAVR